jgi:hypothetical protein
MAPCRLLQEDLRVADRPQISGRVAVLVASALVLAGALPALASFPIGVTAEAVADGGGHLLVSEMQTGGVSASDEFVELYNPTSAALPLEGLELVYVTATGTTVTRKVSWPLGAPSIGAGAHYLVVNDAGTYLPAGDASYAGGVAATGGAWALRIQGAATAIDAVGWGTATAWLEGHAAPAPPAGSSIERLPGGAAGSGQDTDDNLADFAVRAAPTPENAAAPPVTSPPPSPSASASPTSTPTLEASATPTVTPTVAETITPSTTVLPSATPLPTPTPTPAPTPTPIPTPTPSPAPTAPQPITVAAAREMADGMTVTVRAVALTDHDFSDGGGYVADATGGVAVLLASGAFQRGAELLVTGTIDDRYAQRTIRADASGIVVVGPAPDPAPISIATIDVGEGMEGLLVDLAGTIVGGQTTLSGGIAVQLDDGSGEARVFVADVSGIDTGAWLPGSALRIHGVVGQRDSSGTGAAGYRVQPRDPDDVLTVAGPPTPTPLPSASSSPSPTSLGSASAIPSPSATPSATATPAPALVTVAEARAAPTGARLRIRGVVTLPSGLVEPASAVVEDASAAILVRLGDEAGTLRRGELVELSGTRSTKSGMLSLRVAAPPLRLGFRAEPAPIRLATGRAGEVHEARLVLVRGAVSGRVTRSTSGAVSFDVDDGTGPLHVVVAPRTGITVNGIAKGAWLDIRGVLGQQTTGSQPLRGYRVWPRDRGDVAFSTAGTISGGTALAGEGSADSGPIIASGATGATGATGGTAEGLVGSGAPRPSPGTQPGLGPASGTPAVKPALDVERGEARASGRIDATARRHIPTADPEPVPAPIGLMLIGVAGLAAGSAAGWRTGLIGRLLGPSPGGPGAAEGAGRPADAGDAGPDEGPDEVRLARLSVVGGPDGGHP